MHRFIWLATMLPSVCLADQFAFNAPVTDVTVHPNGVTVERRVPFAIPAGQHDLILRTTTADIEMSEIRFVVDGATLETVNAISGTLPPRDVEETDQIKAARAEFDRLEKAVDAMKRDRNSAMIRAEAARAQIAFLEKLNDTDGVVAVGTAGLRDISHMIAEEGLAARKEIQAAEADAKEYDRPLEDLEREFEAARITRDALVPDADEMTEYVLTVSSETGTEGQAVISYYEEDASWHPTYEAYLTRGETPKLRLKRSVWVAQDTGEGWWNVNLHLTTADASDDSAPRTIYPRRYRIEKPHPVNMDSHEGPVLEAPVIVMPSVASLDGISVTYDYPQPVTISSSLDYLRIPLSEITLDADVFAHATVDFGDVYSEDKTGYAAVNVTNTSQEILLPSLDVQLFIDGHFNGVGEIPKLAEGEAGEISFGPILGLKVNNHMLDRNEGDRGMLSKSNQITEAREFQVINLTNTDWPIRLRANPPYSEQEDLQISWTAKPQPTLTNVDGERGIVEWQFDLAAGEQKNIYVDQKLSWPEGYELR